MSELTGAARIGDEELTTPAVFHAVDPATGGRLSLSFASAGTAEGKRACALAEAAFAVFSETAPPARAAFLERAADEIIAIGDALILRAEAETALPRARLEGERARSVGQLRLFAQAVRRRVRGGEGALR